jgi:hypothetical protein
MSSDHGGEAGRDPIQDLLSALAAPLGQLLAKLNLDHVSELKSGVADLFGTLAQIQQSLAHLERSTSELNEQLAAIRVLLTEREDSTST